MNAEDLCAVPTRVNGARACTNVGTLRGSQRRNRPPVVAVHPNHRLDTPLVRCRIDHTAAGQPALELRNLQGQLETHSISDVMAILGEVEAAARRGWYAAGFVAYDAAPAFDSAFRVTAPSPPPGVEATIPLAWFGLFSDACPARPVATGSGQADHRPEARCRELGQ